MIVARSLKTFLMIYSYTARRGMNRKADPGGKRGQVVLCSVLTECVRLFRSLTTKPRQTEELLQIVAHFHSIQEEGPMSLKVLFRVLSVVCALMFLAVGAAPRTGSAQAAGSLNQINHFIVIYQENRSFDSIYGNFPGANGLANAGAAATQVDKNGQPYTTLPQPLNSNLNPRARHALPRRSAQWPVRFEPLHPSPIKRRAIWCIASTRSSTRSTAARWTSSSPWSDAPGLVMGYYDATNHARRASWPSSTRWPTTSSTRVRRLVPQPLLADLRLHAPPGPTRPRPT